MRALQQQSAGDTLYAEAHWLKNRRRASQIRAQALNDPSAANYFIAVVKDGGLARRDGALRLVKSCNNLV